MGGSRGGHPEADSDHGVFEPGPVLGCGDRLGIGPDQLHPVLLEHAGLGQLHGQVQCRLAAEGRQQCIGAFTVDYAGEDIEAQGFDIGGVGKVRVGHNRGRVGVGQDHPVALVAQHATGLGARVVELAGLADHDRARTDQQDALYVVAARH